MDTFALSYLATRFVELRQWVRTRVPYSDSNVAFDILLFAVSRNTSGGAKMKEFYLSLNYSKDRVREVVRDLVADGWLELRQPDDDRRVRVVCASRQLQEVFLAYATSHDEIADIPTIRQQVLPLGGTELDTV